MRDLKNKQPRNRRLNSKRKKLTRKQFLKKAGNIEMRRNKRTPTKSKRKMKTTKKEVREVRVVEKAAVREERAVRVVRVVVGKTAKARRNKVTWHLPVPPEQVPTVTKSSLRLPCLW